MITLCILHFLTKFKSFISKLSVNIFGLFLKFLCRVGTGPGKKSAGRAGPGQIFTGLFHMVVPRDKRDRDKKSRGFPVPSLAHTWPDQTRQELDLDYLENFFDNFF